MGQSLTCLQCNAYALEKYNRKINMQSITFKNCLGWLVYKRRNLFSLITNMKLKGTIKLISFTIFSF